MSDKDEKTVITFATEMPNINHIQCPKCENKNLKIKTREICYIQDAGTKEEPKALRTYIVYAYCKTCGQRARLQHEQYLENSTFSRRVIDIIGECKGLCNMSDLTVSRFMKRTFSVDISEAQVRRIFKKAQKKNETQE